MYNAAIKEAKNTARKERVKRKLYAATDSQPEDVEISMDVIKRTVPLKRVINRRYREFMELHNRLTGGKLSVHMKGKMEKGRDLVTVKCYFKVLVVASVVQRLFSAIHQINH